MVSARYPKQCPKCNREYPMQAQHCGSCGSQLIVGYRGPILKPEDHMHEVVGYGHKEWLFIDKQLEPLPGLFFEPGYYDVEGNYYADTVDYGNNDYSYVLAKCSYCHSTHRVLWKEGTALNCINCGAPVDIIHSLVQTQEQKQFLTNKHNMFIKKRLRRGEGPSGIAFLFFIMILASIATLVICTLVDKAL